ncbi:hypothetical protein [Actinoplanes friuliensis]|uniref:Uncharacterized protein n=1 Tax=Actinoplanes friuliensis DSM 7358 TaxID=1246995 RepID=U5WBM5_9ACTN|nr:hypothetical protein [Actinoplanes friuliensis]AGZ46397.1 hypothetical protein AFR_40715 [Actinoplanes friuliensis DSM 7358]
MAAAPACSALLDLALPDDPSRVTVQVTDGSPELFAEPRSRKFTVLDSSTVRVPVEPVTYLRYGPAAVGAATVLRATISGEVDMRFDPDRIGTTIDLVVGQGAFGPATTTEMNQALVEPTRPPECR